MWGSTNINNMDKLIKSNKGLYEVLTTYPQKIYFDIDKKDYNDSINDYDYLKTLKAIIYEYFPDPDMAVSGSCTDDKTSYHIVLNNYILNNQEDKTKLKEIVLYLRQEKDDAFDPAVYGRNQNLKMINQSKRDDPRIQSIMDDQPSKKHIISAFFNTNMKCIPTLPNLINTNQQVNSNGCVRRSIELNQLPKMDLNLPQDFRLDTATPLDILGIIPLNNLCDHRYTHRIAKYCKQNGLTFEQFWAWRQNKYHNNEIRSKWLYRHWDKLDNFPEVSYNELKKILFKYYPRLQNDYHLNNFIDLFIDDDDIQTEYIETLDQSAFNNDHKYININIGMSGGKTAQTIDYLKKQDSALWITPNQALSFNTATRLEEAGNDFKHYIKGFKTPKDEADGYNRNG